MKFKLFAIVILLALLGLGLYYSKNKSRVALTPQIKNQNHAVDFPLSLAKMREGIYPGSEIKIEEDLGTQGAYNEYISSYQSEGLKIYALVTIPSGEKPPDGWPVIVFNHGYISPEQYKTNERYIAYVDAFARNGYIVFKPDYRGNGNSEGQPEGAYYSAAYATDVLNAVASIKQYKDANTSRIGMWGHSMGGNITLRDIEVSQDIKAAVIWGGVVGSYDDLMNNWQRRVTYVPSQREFALRNRSRSEIVAKYGTPATDPRFWNAIDPVKNLNLVNIPVQLHHGEADEEVPLDFSKKLYDQLKYQNKQVEFYTYPSADHNISASFNLAMERSVAFFDKYLK